MNDPDFDAITRLWKQDLSQEEEYAFRALARRASLKARLLRYADFGIAVLLVAAVVISLFLKPAPATLAVGILAIAGIGWSSWRRHRLGRMAASIESTDRCALVRVAAANAETDLRRSTFGLWFLLPGVLLGALLGHSLEREGLAGFGAAFVEGVMDWPWGTGASIAVILTFLYFWRGNRRLRRELERLRALELEYREEARLDRDMGG